MSIGFFFLIKDNMFEYFVKVFNKYGFLFDILLNVNGVVIFGIMILVKEYFDYLSEMFEEGSEVVQVLSE